MCAKKPFDQKENEITLLWIEANVTPLVHIVIVFLLWWVMLMRLKMLLVRMGRAGTGLGVSSNTSMHLAFQMAVIVAEARVFQRVSPPKSAVSKVSSLDLWVLCFHFLLHQLQQV